MKKRAGFVKSVSTSLAERNASSKESFDLMYKADVVIHDVQAMEADSARFYREQNEITALIKQLETHQEGTPEFESAKQRLDEIFINRAKNSRSKQSEFRRAVRNGLLKLKYEALHVIFMLVTYLLVIVFNVVALIGFIYFLPTITDWLF